MVKNKHWSVQSIHLHQASVAFTTSTIASEPTQDCFFSHVSKIFGFDRSCCCFAHYDYTSEIQWEKSHTQSSTSYHDIIVNGLWVYKYTAARAHTLSSMLVIIYKLFSHLRKRCGTFSLRIKLQLLSSFANWNIKYCCSQFSPEYK